MFQMGKVYPPEVKKQMFYYGDDTLPMVNDIVRHRTGGIEFIVIGVPSQFHIDITATGLKKDKVTALNHDFVLVSRVQGVRT